MSLIIATGSNQGDRLSFLSLAQSELKKKLKIVHASRIYQSSAVDYTQQPDFLNQVLEFQIPHKSPEDVLKLCLSVEKKLGRKRIIKRGPRTVDIDILFWNCEAFHNPPNLIIPHPRLFQRSFVVLPLKETPYFLTLEKHFSFPVSFDHPAKPISSF